MTNKKVKSLKITYLIAVKSFFQARQQWKAWSSYPNPGTARAAEKKSAHDEKKKSLLTIYYLKQQKEFKERTW